MELISASTVLKELGHATRLGIYKKLVKAGTGRGRSTEAT